MTRSNNHLKSFMLPSVLYSSILTQAEPNAIVTCYSDVSCFALLYEQTVNNLRRDVDVVPLAYPLIEQSLRDKKLERFNYGKNPYRLFDMVSWNLDKRPIYAVDISQYYMSFFGLDNGILFYIPQGAYGKLSRSVPEAIEVVPNPATLIALNTKVPEFDLMGRFLINSVSQTHVSNAYFWLKYGERETAQDELNTAVNIAYTLYTQEKKDSLNMRIQIEKVMPDDRYQYGKKAPEAAFLFNLIPDLQQKGQHSRAAYIARSSLLIDPLYIPGRLELAKLYMKMGDKHFAKIEFQNILTIEPTHKDALENLQNL